MKAATELKPVITRGEFSEAPWPIWERGGFERGPDQEDLLRAEQHEIAEAAWQIWQSEGRQDGRALAYWLRAEQQHLAARQQEGKRTQAAAVNRRILLARAKSSARGQEVLAGPSAAVPRHQGPLCL